MVIIMRVSHEFGPFYKKNSKVLILGSMPSRKSLEEGFYYAHPQNRFWKVLSFIYNEDIPQTIVDKKKFLERHYIALWDVIESCDIKGSSDSSIRNVVVNDINYILNNSNVSVIYTTGRVSYNLYNKYCKDNTEIDAIYLPSTSPANCGRGIFEKLVSEYSQIKDITS